MFVIFKDICIVLSQKNKLDYDVNKLNNFEDTINELKLSENWNKKLILKEFFNMIPSLKYTDTGKYLDGKM